MKSNIIVAAAVVGLTAGAASASTISASYQVSGNPFGTEDLKSNVYVAVPGAQGMVDAGAFQMTSSSALGDFVAFCVDIYQPLMDNTIYDVSPNLFSAAVIDNIDRLFTSAYTSVTDGVTAAAFQVSLWEIVADTSSGLDLDSGAFLTKTLSNGQEYNPAVEAQADAFLAGLAGASTGGYDLTFLANPSTQDIVTGTPAMAAVPVPAAGLMLLSGLGGFAAMRRRKAAK